MCYDMLSYVEFSINLKNINYMQHIHIYIYLRVNVAKIYVCIYPPKNAWFCLLITHHCVSNLPKRIHVSNEKNLGWLGYIGDDKLPSYIGIIINHYKDPY